jgi:hypothetical protein
MNNINTGMRLGLLIGFGLSASAALAHSPNGHTYNVVVFSSSDTQFNSCFVFDTAGNLTVGGYGSIVYRHDQLNTQPEAWQATPSSAHIPFGFVLSFHGTVGGDGGQTIVANGMNEFGDTFILQGVVVSSCPPAAAAKATSPFKNH